MCLARRKAVKKYLIIFRYYLKAKIHLFTIYIYIYSLLFATNRIRPIGCIRVKVTCKRRAIGGLIFRYTCFPFFFGSRPIFNKYTITYTFSSSYFYLFYYYYYYFFSLSDLKPILLDFCIFPTPSILGSIP